MGQDHRGRAVAEAELGEDVVHVRLDGPLTEHQLVGDLGVGQAATDQGEDLALACGQDLQGRCIRARGSER